eukprot:scaffold118822_cov75-Phaeocystis_antarctica.AAC.2
MWRAPLAPQQPPHQPHQIGVGASRLREQAHHFTPLVVRHDPRTWSGSGLGLGLGFSPRLFAHSPGRFVVRSGSGSIRCRPRAVGPRGPRHVKRARVPTLQKAARTGARLQDELDAAGAAQPARLSQRALEQGLASRRAQSAAV